MVPHLHIPVELRQLADRLSSAGKQAYLVGGAVRDYFLKRATSDYDVATDARPEEVMRLFPRVAPTGIAHGTVTVLFKSFSVEVTTFRIDKGYSDGRRPDSVEFSTTIESDLERRDFTMNAIAFDLLHRRYIDPYGGKNDIDAKTIRAVGSPRARFSEDGLRPLRAIRFAAQLGFSIESETFNAIPGAVDRFQAVSAERVRDEFCKILMSRWARAGIEYLDAAGLLRVILPELLEGKGIGEKGLKKDDVFAHSCRALESAPLDLTIRLAALLHDIGKPRAIKVAADGCVSFHEHEFISESISRGFLTRLKFPNAVVDRVCALVANHMFDYQPAWTDAAVRRFVSRVGIDLVDDLLALRQADIAATVGSRVGSDSVISFRRRIDSVLAKDRIFGIKDLAVNGNDLAGIGIPRGPQMGTILRDLLDTVIDDPAQNEKSKLLNIATNMWARITH